MSYTDKVPKMSKLHNKCLSRNPITTSESYDFRDGKNRAIPLADKSEMKTDNGSQGEQSSGSRSEAKLSARTSMASCSGSCTKTCSRSTRNGSMPTATALPATTTSVDSLGSSRFSNPKAKNRSERSEMKPRKLNGKLFNAFPTKQRGDSYATTSS